MNLGARHQYTGICHMLLVSVGGVVVVLDAYGDPLEYMEGVEPLDVWVRFTALPDGCHFVTFQLRSFRCHTPDGMEHDEELEQLESTPASSEVLRAYRDNEEWWRVGVRERTGAKESLA